MPTEGKPKEAAAKASRALSGVRHVHYCNERDQRRKRPWQVGVSVGDKRLTFGRFADPNEAGLAVSVAVSLRRQLAQERPASVRATVRRVIRDRATGQGQLPLGDPREFSGAPSCSFCEPVAVLVLPS